MSNSKKSLLAWSLAGLCLILTLVFGVIGFFGGLAIAVFIFQRVE